PHGFRPAPPGHRLGRGVEERDPAIGVGADDRIADNGERDPQPLRLLAQRFLGVLLPRQRDALCVGQNNAAQQFLFAFFRLHEARPPWSLPPASLVPRIRAVILANAGSRLVVVSSQKGANPPSSVSQSAQGRCWPAVPPVS